MLFNDYGNFIDEIEFRMEDSRKDLRKRIVIKQMSDEI